MIFRKAVLIIHGFAGGTYDEEKLANYLELDKFFDVYQFTLPGHERNFSKVSYKNWIESSEQQIEWLIKNGYDKIYLIGHSMGGVIATYIASKYSEVKKLVLAAPAFQYLNVVKNNFNLGKSLKTSTKVIKTYSLEEIFARFIKLNATATKEFITLIKLYYDYPKEVTCPTLILQGNNDNLIPLSSSKYVYDNLNTNQKKIIYINGVTHDLFRNKRELEIYELVRKFLKYRHEKGGIQNI